MTDRPITHAPGCWGWGPRHYECALEEIKLLMAEWERITSAQDGLRFEAEVRARELEKVLAELITWIPSADTYRRLGFDPDAPMQALERARAALGRSGPQ